MNERIRELAEQAGGYVSLSHEHDGKLILSGEDIVEKFAELIVAECMEQVRDEIQYEHDDKLADAVAKRVLTHFGVEE